MSTLERMLIWARAAPYGVLALAGAVGPSEAQLPLACTGDNYLGSLNDPEVIHRIGRFQDQNEYYSFEVHSLGQLNPTYPDSPWHMCLRYDVTNTGSERIERFRWPDAKINFIPLDPNQSWVSTPPEVATKRQKAEAAKTDVGAFDNSSVKTEAAFTNEQAVRKETAYLFEDGKSLDPSLILPSDFVEALKASNLTPAAIFAISWPAENTAYPTFHQGLRGASTGLAISTTAELAFDGQTAMVSLGTSFIKSSETRLYAPYFSALQMYEELIAAEGPIDDTKAVRIFLEYLNKSIGEEAMPAESKELSRTLLFPVTKDTTPWPLFLVEHAVSVINGKGDVICISAQAYSPLPISLPDSQCMTPENR